MLYLWYRWLRRRSFEKTLLVALFLVWAVVVHLLPPSSARTRCFLALAGHDDVQDRGIVSRRRLGGAALSPFLPLSVSLPACAEAAGSSTNDARANEFLAGIPVWVVTNPEGQPAFEPDEQVGSEKRSGRFYFSSADASAALQRLGGKADGAVLEVRTMPLSEVYLPLIVGGDASALGGQLRLEPLSRELRNARQVLDMGSNSIGPPGTVPLFLYPGLELQDAQGKSFSPGFLREGDLRETVKLAGGTVAAGRTKVAFLQDVVDKLREPDLKEAGAPLRAVTNIDNVRKGR